MQIFTQVFFFPLFSSFFAVVVAVIKVVKCAACFNSLLPISVGMLLPMIVNVTYFDTQTRSINKHESG